MPYWLIDTHASIVVLDSDVVHIAFINKKKYLHVKFVLLTVEIRYVRVGLRC